MYIYMYIDTHTYTALSTIIGTPGKDEEKWLEEMSLISHRNNEIQLLI